MSAHMKVFAALAAAGGAMRVIASFMPWTPENAGLEAFYLAIDLALLFGLTGFYLAVAGRTGIAGLAGYLVAASGIALIVGPDGTAFGIDLYQAGVVVIALGLVILSAALLLAREARLAAALWLVAIAAAPAGAALGQPGFGFAVAGVLFGAAFIVAGLHAWRGRGV